MFILGLNRIQYHFYNLKTVAIYKKMRRLFSKCQFFLLKKMVSAFGVFFYDFLRMLSEFVAAHYLNVALDGAHRDTLGNAFTVVQSVLIDFN